MNAWTQSICGPVPTLGATGAGGGAATGTDAANWATSLVFGANAKLHGFVVSPGQSELEAAHVRNRAPEAGVAVAEPRVPTSPVLVPLTEPGPSAIKLTVTSSRWPGVDVDVGAGVGAGAGRLATGAAAVSVSGVTGVGPVVLPLPPPQPLRARPASKDNFASGST
jgi:hypothetical protein